MLIVPAELLAELANQTHGELLGIRVAAGGQNYVLGFRTATKASAPAAVEILGRFFTSTTPLAQQMVDLPRLGPSTVASYLFIQPRADQPPLQAAQAFVEGKWHSQEVWIEASKPASLSL